MDIKSYISQDKKYLLVELENYNIINYQVEIVNNNIPENSNTLLLSETTSRFSSAAWFDSILSSEIVVAGLGGIGSNLCYLLSRLNPGYMIIYDNDQIEPANLSGQLYRDLDVGQFKADATYNINPPINEISLIVLKFPFYFWALLLTL